MAEGSERGGGEPGEGTRGRLGEGDLLAERRLRRSGDTPEAAMGRRAEAAEATVHTLERHVASLQQRLAEAEAEHSRLISALEDEREAGAEHELELRRAKQREYAEQQLRVEAEDELVSRDRSHREDDERLDQAERQVQALSARMHELERQLVEAEQAAAAERSALLRAEQELRGRLEVLERRAARIERDLAQEREQRSRSEEELRSLRAGSTRVEGIVGEIRTIVSRLGGVIAQSAQRPEPPRAIPETAPWQEAPEARPAPPPPPSLSPRLTVGPPRSEAAAAGAEAARGGEIADALAAAVERLRARADAAAEQAAASAGDEAPRVGGEATEPRAVTTADAPEAVPEPAVTSAESAAPAARQVPLDSSPEPPERRAGRPPHKHSRSLIGRIRDRRKERKSR